MLEKHAGQWRERAPGIKIDWSKTTPEAVTRAVLSYEAQAAAEATASTEVKVEVGTPGLGGTVELEVERPDPPDAGGGASSAESPDIERLKDSFR